MIFPGRGQWRDLPRPLFPPSSAAREGGGGGSSKERVKANSFPPFCASAQSQRLWSRGKGRLSLRRSLKAQVLALSLQYDREPGRRRRNVPGGSLHPPPVPSAQISLHWSFPVNPTNPTARTFRQNPRPAVAPGLIPAAVDVEPPPIILTPSTTAFVMAISWNEERAQPRNEVELA